MMRTGAMLHATALMIAVVMVCVSAAQAQKPILFDVEMTRAALAALPVDHRKRLCGPAQKKWPSHKAITTIKPPKGYGGDPRMEPFALTVMALTSRILAFDDDAAEDALRRLLNRWADGRAMSKIGRDRVSATYSAARALLPTIIGYSVLEAVSGPGDKHNLIETWLRRAVKKARRDHVKMAGNQLATSNNHALLYASVIAAWGAHRNDPQLLNEAYGIVFRTLQNMRTDGSLPLETQRGARALWYQRHAIASLVTIAEIAALRGANLYREDREGRSIHRAIQFLADSIKQPDLVAGYASANVNPGPFEDHTIQDMGFMRLRGHGRHYMAWFEIYRQRFPDRPLTAELSTLLDQYNPGWRPMIDDYSGGNTSCFYAATIQP